MQAWFYAADTLAEQLTELFNRIAAGQVPASIVPLLTAGRDVAIPKPGGVGLRPVAVGSILLRFVGTLTLTKKSTEISAFFLEPRSLQFAVGLAGGCELMAAAITAFLDENQGWVDIATDAKNAFISFCRSRMWGPLLQLFPSLAALGRLMYGDASSIVFNEPGVGRTYLLSSVGTRQGCSWGSLLYCLTTQPHLQQLADEFPDCKALAFADDAQILGPPQLAAQAYELWRFLYGALLQDELNDPKSKCYSPRLSEDSVRKAGLPSGIEVSTEGTRVRAGPWDPPPSVKIGRFSLSRPAAAAAMAAAAAATGNGKMGRGCRLRPSPPKASPALRERDYSGNRTATHQPLTCWM